jgi:hypothetical protein
MTNLEGTFTDISGWHKMFIIALVVLEVNILLCILIQMKNIF